MKLRQWLSDKCFTFVHGNNLVYNTCWEDPALDRVALELSPADNLMVITSAGCNALDYLLAGVGHVHAVDVNPRQNSLLRLKLAAAASLSYEDFFQMFGKGGHPRIREIYHDTLRNHLTSWAKNYWDRRYKFFTGRGWRDSFYFRGTSGIFARLVNTWIDRVAKVRPIMQRLLDAPTLEEQQQIYKGELKPRFWRRFLKWAVRRDATLSLLGVPRPQRFQIERYYEGGIAQFIEDCMDTVFSKLPLKSNYFWRVYIEGEYTQDCCPEYLKKDNFEKLKSRLQDVTIHTNTVTGFLNQHDKPITRFVLLDHMDWLASIPQPYLQEEWQAIVNRSADRAKLIYRSGGLKVDYIEPLVVKHNGQEKKMAELLHYNTELAAKLHEQDRVHTYGSFYIADLVK